MKICINDKEQGDFFSKLKALSKHYKIKRWGNARHHRSRRVEYVVFNGKDIEEDKLINFLNALENRYGIAYYCLEQIRKECEIVEGDESNFEELNKKLKSQTIELEFLIKCEYFIFAIASCLDTMAHLVNIAYNFSIQENRISIGSVFDKLKRKRDSFSRYFMKEWKAWIDEFKFIRNRMTHHQIIGFTSQINHQPQNKKVTFTKHSISTLNEKGDEINKPLPTYFEDIIKNYENLRHEFYKKLNSLH